MRPYSATLVRIWAHLVVSSSQYVSGARSDYRAKIEANEGALARESCALSRALPSSLSELTDQSKRVANRYVHDA